MKTWVYLLRFFVTTLLIVLCAGAFGQNTGPAPDIRFNRSVAVGPYSHVETGYGGLSTVVPLVQLKGLGNTSVSVNLQNRSNLIANTSFAAPFDSPGAGWNLDNIDAININGGTDPVGHNAFIHQIAGDTVEWWDYGITGSSYSSITPFNGVRQTCTLEYSGGTSTSNVVGVVLTDERTLTKTYYEYHANAAVGPFYVFWKSRVVDTFGNTVTYNYGVDPAGHARPASITDASSRTVTFNYSGSSPYLLQSVVLNAAGTTRTWSLNNSYFINSSYYLGNIIFPRSPREEAPRPIKSCSTIGGQIMAPTSAKS